MQRERQAVAAGAAGLLRVGFERARQIVVHDEADVRLVDAQTERVGRDDGANRLVHEEFVHRACGLLLQLGVIDRGRNVRAGPCRYCCTSSAFLIVAV